MLTVNKQETFMFRAIVFGLVLLMPLVVLAHHGGSEYDLASTVEFKASLTRIDLINPHSWLYFDTTGTNGTISQRFFRFNSFLTNLIASSSRLKTCGS